MILRKYEVRDEGAVLELLRLLIPRYFAESELADFKEYLKNNLEYYYVVEVKGQLVGAGGFNVLAENTTIRISWDFIHPNFQGFGVGKQLIAYRLKLIKELYPAHKVEVRTSQMAYKFYEKQGFLLQEIVEDYWAVGFDLYAMCLLKE